jgi:hypothetical protein
MKLILGEKFIYCTKALLGLCTSIKMQKSVSKSSYLPDQKSVCEQYGIYNTDLQPRQKRKEYKKDRNSKGRYKWVPRTHYYDPKDIHLKTHKAELKQKSNAGSVGKKDILHMIVLIMKQQEKGKGKLSEQRAKEFREKRAKKKEDK